MSKDRQRHEDQDAPARSGVTRRGVLKTLSLPAVGLVFSAPVAVSATSISAGLPIIGTGSVDADQSLLRRCLHEVAGNHGCPGIPPYAGGRPPIYVSIPCPHGQGTCPEEETMNINGHPVPLRRADEPEEGGRLVMVGHVMSQA